MLNPTPAFGDADTKRQLSFGAAPLGSRQRDLHRGKRPRRATSGGDLPARSKAEGLGPPCRYLGSRTLYQRAALDRWVIKKPLAVETWSRKGKRKGRQTPPRGRTEVRRDAPILGSLARRGVCFVLALDSPIHARGFGHDTILPADRAA